MTDISEVDFIVLCYRGGTLGWLLGFALFVPFVLPFTINGTALFFHYDFGLFMFYNVVIFVVLAIAYMLNVSLRGPWLPGFEHCNFPAFSLPDVSYVTVGTFVLVVALVGFSRRTNIRLLTSVIFFSIFAFQTASLAYNAYQPLSHLFFSIALMLALANVSSVIYLEWLVPYDERMKGNWLTRFMNIDNSFAKTNRRLQ